MDTMILQRPRFEKAATSAAGIGIALCLMFMQNLQLHARDAGGITGLSPTLNYIQDKYNREKSFDSEIALKYKNLNVVEVEKGVKYVRMIKFYNNKPVRINVVELSRSVNEDLVIEPATASEKLASRAKISNIAKRDGAIVAINGGYFKPQTGVPLGTLMINKKVITGPVYDRVALGIFDKDYNMARVQLKASVETNIGGLKIDNINQPRMLSTHSIVYTKDWGEYSPQSPKYGIQIAVDGSKIVNISKDRVQIPENGFVIVGPESKLSNITKAKRLDLNVKINPQWKDVNHIISGGPYLVRNNEIYVDMKEQKLASIGGRNPRTAIGYTKDNNLIMLTADGREGASVGLTLYELAMLMKELGCVNAMNFDGGGSTVMFINGKVVNKPPVYGGIPLSHTLEIRKIS